MKITLLGAGAWGTALAIAFAGKHEVVLWSRELDVAVDLQNTRENHRFFPGYKLPESVAISTDFAAAVASAELLVVATPIAGLRPTVERLASLKVTLPVLWVCKGFEAGTGKLPHQVVTEARFAGGVRRSLWPQLCRGGCRRAADGNRIGGQ